MNRWKDSGGEDIPLKRPKGVSEEQWKKAIELYKVASNRNDRYPELTVAQAALETGWFKQDSGRYNYFGQKASNNQAGTVKTTKEVSNNSFYGTKAKFRDYENLEQAVDDRLKKWGSKYKDAKNLQEAIDSIWWYDEEKGRGAGYATDPNYGGKLKSILNMLGSTNLKEERAVPTGNSSENPLTKTFGTPNLPTPQIFSFSNKIDDAYLNSIEGQGMAVFIQAAQQVADLRDKEAKEKQEEVATNKYKAALQKKINERSFLAELIGNMETPFVERVFSPPTTLPEQNLDPSKAYFEDGEVIQ